MLCALISEVRRDAKRGAELKSNMNDLLCFRGGSLGSPGPFISLTGAACGASKLRHKRIDRP